MWNIENSQIKILIVDDTPENLEVLGSVLEKNQFDVYLADSGEIALELVVNTEFDLILLDIMMPGMDGFEVLRRLKALPEYQGVPVMFLTAKVEPEAIVKGFECGAVDYIKKPFNPQELLARVKTHMELKKAKEDLVTKNKNQQELYDKLLRYDAELEEKVEKRSEELRIAMSQLMEREKMATLGGLVAGITHEINTPLGVSVGAISFLDHINQENRAKLAAGEMSMEELIEFFENLQDSISILKTNLQRATELIQGFKQVAVNQSHETRTRFSLLENINSVLVSLKHEYKKRPIKFTINCPEGLILNSFPGAVTQILTNLIMNSLIHAFKGNETGEITIEATETGGIVNLRYADNGRGISEDNLSHLFDPFFTTNKENGGSGLGTNIIYNLVVNQLKGKIECRSTVGLGTSYFLEFPVDSIG